LGALLVVLLASSCSMTPDYKRPDAPTTGRWRNTGEAAAATLVRPSTEWWKSFGSEELNGLVERALANNQDLKAAAARVLQAQYLVKQASASLWPSLSLTAGRTITAPGSGVGVPEWTHTAVQQTKLWEIGPRLTYEFDLWGKNAANEASAIASAEGSEFDRQAITLSLVGDVISNYFTILALKDLTAIATTSRDNAKSTLEAIEAKASIHEATQVEVMQQRSAVARNESQLASYKLQLDQTQSKLSILLGASPSEPLGLTGASLKDLQVPAVDTGLPSELLLRRPDIGKAEANLRAANANIGIARAQFLPSLSLTGSAGRGGFSLASLLSPQALYYNLATSITQMIFDGGRAKAQEKQTEARFDELVHAYSGVVLNALLEVESTLAADTLLGEQEAADIMQFESSREAYSFSRTAFKAGRLEYQTMLETERTLLTAESGATLTRLSRLRNSVALFKALGGDTTTLPDKEKEKEGK
jgi:NodT family efflux transporter outer membrane factor (OMF) lipoprotein